MKHTFTFFALSIALIVIFQNCGGFKTLEQAELMNSNQPVGDINSKSIWHTNRLFLSSKDMIFYLNPNLFDKEATYGWFYELNGLASGCHVDQYETFVNAAVINCPTPGVLHLTAVVVHADFSSEKIEFNALIEKLSNYAGILDTQIYYAENELILKPNGMPGLSYESSPPASNPAAMTGPELYTSNCAQCHGPLATSIKRGASVLAIKNGISKVEAMAFLSVLSSEELNKISVALSQ